GPEQAATGEQEDRTQSGEQGGHAQADLEGGGGDGADTELTDEAVDSAGPDVAACGGVGRVVAVEVLPVLATVGVLDGPAFSRERAGDGHHLVADLHLGEGVALGVDELGFLE